ncbi:MAG: DNA primase [Treponema sp.]|jgi:DNA primase|nr:DNA primase [Treponema sp.]
MTRIAQSTLQELHDRLDAAAVVGDYVRLEQRGQRFVGLCPFHHEKTPSFMVNPDAKLYHCFGCGKGGTVLSFVMEMDKLSFPETVELLAKRFAIPIVYEGGSQRGAESQLNNKRVSQITELYTRVAKSFHYFLMERPEGRAALQYLASRKISQEMLEKFRLGYAPAERHWLFSFLTKKGYSEAFLASSRLFTEKYPRSSFFAKRLIFPIADHYGKTIAFGGRLLPGDEGPKYLNSSESDFYKKGQTLFAIDIALAQIRQSKTAYIAEGYMDVIALHQAGVSNAVAPLGAAFTDEQAKLLRRWAEQVNLVFDTDEAGQRATEKAILTCRKNSLICSVVMNMANMKDPAEILKEAGAEALQNTMQNLVPDLDFLLLRYKKLFDLSSSEGKAKAVSALFPYLETLDSEVARDAAVSRIAQAFDSDRNAIRADFNRKPTPRQARPASQKTRPISMDAELYLLIAVALNQRLFPEFRAQVSLNNLESPAAKDLFIALEECLMSDEFGIDDLLVRIESDEVRNFFVAQAVLTPFFAKPEQLIADGVRQIKRRCLKKQREKLIVELHIAKNQTETPNHYEDILAKKKHIDNELQRI